VNGEARGERREARGERKECIYLPAYKKRRAAAGPPFI